MKYSLSIICLMWIGSAFSQMPGRILPRQAMIRFEITNQLEKDGMQPKTDVDGRITFTHARMRYSLDLSEDQSPLFYARLSLECGFFLSDMPVRECVEAFNREFNYKLVKVVEQGGKCSIRNEFLLRDASYFKDVYHRHMELMIRVYNSLQAKCTAERHTEPAEESVAEPSTKLSEPAVKPHTEQAEESVVKPSTKLSEPAAEPQTEPAGESVAEPSTKPVADTVRTMEVKPDSIRIATDTTRLRPEIRPEK